MPVYNEDLSRFIRENFSPEDDHGRRTREISVAEGLPQISINPEEGQFLSLLTAASGGRSALEIGTLGGYSGMWIARGLANGGKLTTIDLNGKHTAVGRRNITEAGLSDKVEFLTGPALEVLKTLEGRDPFDFIFIDADKESYPAYYEWAVEHLRTGGILTAHNAFRAGRITQTDPDEETIAFKAFLESVASDPRVTSSIYPAGDGTLIAVKIQPGIY